MKERKNGTTFTRALLDTWQGHLETFEYDNAKVRHSSGVEACIAFPRIHTMAVSDGFTISFNQARI